MSRKVRLQAVHSGMVLSVRALMEGRVVVVAVEEGVGYGFKRVWAARPTLTGDGRRCCFFTSRRCSLRGIETEEARVLVVASSPVLKEDGLECLASLSIEGKSRPERASLCWLKPRGTAELAAPYGRGAMETKAGYALLLEVVSKSSEECMAG